MDIRKARPADASGIQRVARASLVASYVPPLSAGIVDDAVEAWYDPETVEESLADPTSVFLVAVQPDGGDGEETLVAFAQSAVIDDGIGVIQWLHVDPDARGAGVGDALFERTREALDAHGVETLRGLVLAGNEDGVAFYEARGFERREERTVEIESEPHIEYVYEAGDPGDLPMTAYETEGQTVYVAPDESEHGGRGAFYVVYASRARDERYGWFCANCESFDTAMDAMGRIECNSCGNRRKATRWDASYL